MVLLKCVLQTDRGIAGPITLYVLNQEDKLSRFSPVRLTVRLPVCINASISDY